MVNMAIPFYQGISLPFVASIVIGAIQLGATVDYAILMTTAIRKSVSVDEIRWKQSVLPIKPVCRQLSAAD